MDNKICLHGIACTKCDGLYDKKYTLKVLESILKSEELLSPRLQGMDKKEYGRIGYNGLDYISLCDYEKKEKLNNKNLNSYIDYILSAMSLVFPKNKLKIIEPIIIPMAKITSKSSYIKYLAVMKEYGMSETDRYTDLPDEVQVKDRIPLSFMKGITIPINELYNIFYSERKYTYEVMKEIEKIHKLLAKYRYDVPIYDIKTMESLDDEANVKKLVKEYYKNRG